MKGRITKEWFRRASRDLETARLIFSHHGYPEEIILLLQQALEKYLKGYLIFQGWELKKIHDLETLLTEAIGFDKSFEKFLDLGRKLTAFYYEERYPPAPVAETSKEELVETFKSAQELIQKIKSKVKLARAKREDVYP